MLQKYCTWNSAHSALAITKCQRWIHCNRSRAGGAAVPSPKRQQIARETASQALLALRCLTRIQDGVAATAIFSYRQQQTKNLFSQHLLDEFRRINNFWQDLELLTVHRFWNCLFLCKGDYSFDFAIQAKLTCDTTKHDNN